jgi:hypothetical protein
MATDDTRTTDFLLAQLVNALQLVALPLDRQVAVLPSFVNVQDEVMLLYADAFLGVPQLRDAGVVSADQEALLAELDELLDGDLTGDRWDASRRLATEALTMLGEPPDEPRFDGVSWVQG